MDKQDAAVLASILVWAYQNRITVELWPQGAYGGNTYPMLKFSRGDKHISQAFFPMSDLEGQAEACWKSIGMALCVEPLEIFREGESDG